MISCKLNNVYVEETEIRKRMADDACPCNRSCRGNRCAKPRGTNLLHRIPKTRAATTLRLQLCLTVAQRHGLHSFCSDDGDSSWHKTITSNPPRWTWPFRRRAPQRSGRYRHLWSKYLEHQWVFQESWTICFSGGRFENELRKDQTWSDAWPRTFFRKRVLLRYEIFMY